VVDASVFELFSRLVIALAIVIGLMILCARVLKKRGVDLTSGGRRNAGPRQTVDVLARRVLTRNASVAVVRAGGKTLVLGVTDQQVTMLTEGAVGGDGDGDGEPIVYEEAQWTELPVAAGVGARGGSPWKMALESLRERTVRRD
jgi:flagellar protein FliO/FliZ